MKSLERVLARDSPPVTQPTHRSNMHTLMQVALMQAVLPESERRKIRDLVIQQSPSAAHAYARPLYIEATR